METEIDDLAYDVINELRKYTTEKIIKINKALNKAGRTALKDIKEKAPVNTSKYAPLNAGLYKQNWKTKAIKKGNYFAVRVYQSKTPQLTHLLEDGHKVYSWGKATSIHARAFKHIKPVEEKVNEQLKKDIDKILKE